MSQRPTSRSSAAASAASAWRSASSRPESTTSSCWSAPTRSAAPGRPTPTRAARATCPRTSTRSRFAPNPDWTRRYSTQPEIWAYLRRVADDFGVRSHVRLEHRGANPRRGTTTATGELETTGGPVTARVLVAGVGPLTEPSDPRDPRARGLRRAGLPLRPLGPRARPRGQARRRRSAPVRRRSSSCPRSSPTSRSCTSSSARHRGSCPTRTGRSATGSGACTARLPAAQRLVRGGIYCGREALVLGFVKNPRLMKLMERLARKHLRAPDRRPRAAGQGHPGLHDRLQADPALQRWYPALGEPNVELVTDAIREVRGARDRDGRRTRARGRHDRPRHRLPA